MTEQKFSPFDWAFWFQWIMATTLGWVLGRFLVPNLAFVVIGIAMGVLQSFVLQQRMRKSWRWIIATSLGWLIGATLVQFFASSASPLLAGLLIGLSTGIAQWLILRDELSWAVWWIMINVVAWTTGLALLPGLLLTGVMAGVITGIAIELLYRYPKPSDRV